MNNVKYRELNFARVQKKNSGGKGVESRNAKHRADESEIKD